MSKLEKTRGAFTLGEKLGFIGQVGEGEIQVSSKKRKWNVIVMVLSGPVHCRLGWWSVRKRAPFGAWYSEAIRYMQGQTSIGERLRFDWVPVLVWKIRSDDSLQAVLFGWSKSIFLTRNTHGTEANKIVISQEIEEEHVFKYYYDKPQKQEKDQPFSQWLTSVYDNDLPYFQHTLWTWVEEAFDREFRGLYQCPI